MKARPANLNIREVARRSGVSPATVSRIINGQAHPGKNSHRRVLEVISRSGYTRQRRVRKTGRRRVLFVHHYAFYPGQHSHGLEMANALGEVAANCGMELISSHCLGMQALADFVATNRVDGLIFFSDVEDVPLPLPTVVINRHLTRPGMASVDCDDVRGMALAIRHLRELGHRRIGYFCDCAPNPQDIRPRISAIPLAYELAGVEYDPGLVFGEDFPFGQHMPTLRRMVAYFLGMADPPTALMLPGDIYAPDLYDLLHAAGRRVPEDISVVGFDDMPSAAMIRPQLTTVRKPLFRMTEEAMRLLARQLAGHARPDERLLLCPELIVRASTARPDSTKRIRTRRPNAKLPAVATANP